MRPMFVLPLVIVAVLPGPARAGECPVDTLDLRNRTSLATPTIVTQDSSGLFSVVGAHPDFLGVFGVEQVEYDLAAGTVHLTANSTPTNPIYCWLPTEASAHLGITADILGSLSIVGLPEGYEVRSCQGFRAGTIVPIQNRSWWSIKTLYR